ncbi:hypothetical protein CPLU01_15108 [Colletotrichum plurivorum]|uniref:Uncharacterized protein n=1 Tax=Colletotrichum plurivorum TaxID=2175906 RepID=A0A8H6MX44_9PEZI|nr:hypothetical protein CPLU01_15108 [Colletotrichum plurivorum]
MDGDSILRAMQRTQRHRSRASSRTRDERTEGRNVPPVDRVGVPTRTERPAAVPRDDEGRHRHAIIVHNNNHNNNSNDGNSHHDRHGVVPGHQNEHEEPGEPGWLARLGRWTWGAIGWWAKVFLIAVWLACWRFRMLRTWMLWTLVMSRALVSSWILEAWPLLSSAAAGPHVQPHPPALNTTTVAFVCGGHIPQTCVSAVALSMPDMINQLAIGGGGLAGTWLDAEKVARGRAACEAVRQVLGSARIVASGVERRVEGAREEIATLYSEAAAHVWRPRWRAALGISRPNIALVAAWVARLEDIVAAMGRELDVLLAVGEEASEEASGRVSRELSRGASRRASEDSVGVSVSASVSKISDVLEQTCGFSDDVGQYLQRISSSVKSPSSSAGGHDSELVYLVAMDGAASGICMVCRVVHGVHTDQQQLVAKLKREQQFQVRSLSARLQSIRAGIRGDDDDDGIELGWPSSGGAAAEMELARQWQGQLLQVMDRLNTELGALYYVKR